MKQVDKYDGDTSVHIASENGHLEIVLTAHKSNFLYNDDDDDDEEEEEYNIHF